jgi:hypothetical protein
LKREIERDFTEGANLPLHPLQRGKSNIAPLKKWMGKSPYVSKVTYE